MNCHLKLIAVLDKEDNVHAVEFTTGVNIITGKSSTGKSAMIEIFDYCFGNSDYTVPAGVITDTAELYFIILSVNKSNIVLARKPQSNKAFLREETVLPESSNFSREYFNNNYFLPMPDFKKVLGRHFGLIIEDTDTDLADKKYRYRNAKAPRPSVRNFTSFMLQHQNLVANKHSLFYRFDEKEKREQTIDQFKIFAGFVTQDYFIKKQQLNELGRELKVLKNKQERIRVRQEEKEQNLFELLKEYLVITGKSLLAESAQSILVNPANTLEKIKFHKVEVNINSDKYLKELAGLKNQQNKLLAEKRNLEINIGEIQSSIKYAEKHKKEISNISTIQEATIHLSECPFCKKRNEELSQEANLLDDAISWLNEELSKTPLLLDSFLSNEKSLKLEISNLDNELRLLNQKIIRIQNSVADLKKNKSLEEQALKVKLKTENLLEEKIDNNISELENKIANTQVAIKGLENDIKEKFNPTSKLRTAEEYINKTMKEIGEHLDFEDSYKPINLKFSLDTFELWHEKIDKSKVFLRSMGSGANWLYCHIALFTGIQKYFCSLGNKSLIPPILFLDQPSQVYFPATIDIKDSFDAEDLKKKEGKLDELDEDLLAVKTLFNQLINHCKKTSEETGITPQIIVTDHADNLKLDDVDFETLVNGRRWRKRGFINVKGIPDEA